MAQRNMNARFVQKHDIEANWNKASNFYPLAGEIIIYDPDDKHDYPRFKVGQWDGKTYVNENPDPKYHVTNLPFIAGTDLYEKLAEYYTKIEIDEIIDTLNKNFSNEIADFQKQYHEEYSTITQEFSEFKTEYNDEKTHIYEELGRNVEQIADLNAWKDESAARFEQLGSADRMLDEKIETETERAMDMEATIMSRLAEMEFFFQKDQIDETLDTLLEIQKYVDEHGEAAAKMADDIASNTEAISKVTERVETLENNDHSALLKFALNADEKGYTLTGTTVSSGELPKVLIIPEMYNNKPVTAIGDSALYGRTTITELVIPDTVTTIGASAFFGCSALASVKLSANLQSLGRAAFNGCSSLTAIDLPNTLKTIENFTFTECSSLMNVHIPEGIIVIGYSAFHKATNLQTVTMGSTVRLIGGYAFSNSPSLSVVELPEGLVQIEQYAFSNCPALRHIEIPKSVTHIGYRAFHDSKNIESIILPFVGPSRDGSNGDGQTTTHTLLGYIFNGALTSSQNAECVPASLKKVTLTDTTWIPKNAFVQCTHIESIELPKGLTSIGDFAFCECHRLVDINIPEGVKTIGGSAFSGCRALPRIEFPNTVTRLGDWALCECFAMTELVIPNGVTELEEGLCYDATALAHVEIPESVTEIGDWVFCGCVSLKDIYLPRSITYIGAEILWGCEGLESITIPFVGMGEGDTEPYFGYLFGDASCWEQGENAPPKLTSVTILSGDIPLWGFVGYRKLEKVVLPENATTIGGAAFSGCNIHSIIIPDSVKFIGTQAFEGCSKLEKLVFGENSELISIDMSAFGSTSLKGDLVLPSKLTLLAEMAFSGCNHLTSVVIPKNITTILGSHVFAGCADLIVYCEAAKKPDNWSEYWAGTTQIKWGYVSNFRDLHDKLSNLPTGNEIKIGSTVFTEDQLKKVLAFIDTIALE